LNGYQLIPMSDVQSGSGAEDNTWLQSTSTCANAVVSSNNYFYSASYKELFSSTDKMYQSLAPFVNHAMRLSQLTYKNAYTIWDLLHVASIHNSSSTTLPSSQEMNDLFVLANTHEYNLAYNSNDTIRAVAGMTLAGQIVSALNKTITSGGKSKLNIQFGAYSTFLSYFGLAGLGAENVNFTGMPDYASSMAWELVTNASGTGIPPESDVSVRFMFHNGTSIAGSTQLQTYPLFGLAATTVPWTQFVSYTNKFAISTQEQWCQSCGNTTGICSTGSDASANSSSSSSSSGGMSLGVAGVIGAMVTLGVLAGFTALIMIVFGLRLVRKSTLAAISRGSETSVAAPVVKRPSV
jgi:acid phosphatase